MSWKPEHWLGVIGVISTFGAAVGGAWVGGSIATKGARQLQEDQARRDHARELAAARAAGRLLVAEMRGVFFNVQASGLAACWWPLDYKLNLSVDDRRLLAAELPRREWAAVLTAFRWTEFVALERRDGFQWHSSSPSRDMSLVVGFVQTYARITPRLATFARSLGLPLGRMPRTLREYDAKGSAPPRAMQKPECVRATTHR